MSVIWKKRLGVLLLAGVSLGFLAGMFRAGWQIIDSQKVASWPTTQGIVIETKAKYDTRVFGDDFVPVVRFRYQVAGEAHESTLIWRYATGVSKRQAEQIANRYPPGSQVVVHYDPHDPQTGVLQPGLYSNTARKQMIGFGTIILIGSWALAWLAWRIRGT